METSTFTAFEQRKKEEEVRETRRRAKAGEGDSDTDAQAEAVNEQATDADDAQRPQTVRRDTPKLGRNDLCHCGSGKKFKKCHG